MRSTTRTLWWMGAAASASSVAGLAMLALFGAGRQGTELALLATARVAFLLFWVAYSGAPLVTLFGPRLGALKRHGRDAGLGFAAAQTVHMGFVAWLCWIGAAPALRVFVFFGTALLCMYVLVAFSIGPLGRTLAPKVSWLIRAIAMNDIALAFAADFLRHKLGGGLGHSLVYMPFALLSVLGPVLYLCALAVRAARAWDGAAGPQRKAPPV